MAGDGAVRALLRAPENVCCLINPAEEEEEEEEREENDDEDGDEDDVEPGERRQFRD